MKFVKFRRGNRTRQQGAAAVEFALLAPFYFLLLLGIVEFGIMFWVDLTMQYAVREGARFAITGQIPNPTTEARYQAVIRTIRENSIGLYDQVSPVIATSVNGAALVVYGNPQDYNAGMFGGPGDIITLQLNCQWPAIVPLMTPFFSGGTYSFSVAATMRNEG